MYTKILEVNGQKYSRKPFEGYSFSCKVRLRTVSEEYFIDLYTTDPYMLSVENVLIERRSDKIVSIALLYWSTKEQDDTSNELIEEMLNKI